MTAIAFKIVILTILTSLIAAQPKPTPPVHNNGCPNRAFLSCILALKEEHIQFDRNIVRTILSIDSEAKLLHTCKAYTKVLPCFRDKVLECGNQHQRELFGEVGRALMFLCSPFSLQRQRVLVEKQSCISKVLSLPISVGCKLTPKPYGKQLLDCKRECAATQNNFSCSLKTWMSEQNACTLNDISENCGQEAADFYADFQASVFEPNYPFLCHPTDRMIHPFTNEPTKKQNITIVTVKHRSNSKNFTRPQLSIRKTTKKPRLDVFYVSPRAEPVNDKSKEIFRVYKLSTKAVEAPPTTLPPATSSSQSMDSSHDHTASQAQPQIPQVQQTFMALVEKLLPIALQHNMTSLLQQQSKLLELSRKIDIKDMLSKKEGPKVMPTTMSYRTTTTGAPIYSTARASLYSTTKLPVFSTPVSMVTSRPWRPWYFVSTDEEQQ